MQSDLGFKENLSVTGGFPQTPSVRDIQLKVDRLQLAALHLDQGRTQLRNKFSKLHKTGAFISKKTSQLKLMTLQK